jgi:O-antigen/teichoic acid export membrane protein
MFARIVYTSLGKVFSLIAGLLTLIVTARCLGPEARGEVIAVTVLMSMFATAGHFSTGPNWIREANQRKSMWQEDAISFTVFNTAFISLSLYLLFFLDHTFELGVFTGWSAELLPFGLLLVPFTMLEYYSQQLLMARGQLNFYTNYLVLGRTFGLLLLFLAFAYTDLNELGYLLSVLLAQASIALLCLSRVLDKSVKLQVPEISMLGAVIKQSKYTHLTTAGVMAFSSGGIVLLNIQAGPEVAGYYQIAYQLILMLVLVGQSASMVLYSRVAVSNDADSWTEQKRVIRLVTLLYILGALLVFLVAPTALAYLIGVEYAESAELLNILLIALPMYAFNNLMVHQWAVLGLYKYLSYISLAAGALTFLVGYACIPLYGASAVAWSYVVCTAMTTIFSIYLYRLCNGLNGQSR